MKRIGRRSFLKKSSGAVLGAAATKLIGISHPAKGADQAFHSEWPPEAERSWPGPEYWTNPLQDWRIRQGRLECIGAGGDRNVFLLTRDVSARNGMLSMSVRLGRLEPNARQLDEGFVGFRVGIRSFVDDYRAWAVHGRGLNIGVAADGRLFVDKLEATAPHVSLDEDLRLWMEARPSGINYTIVLRAFNLDDAKLAELQREVPREWLEGGVALVCSSAKIEPTPQPLGELHGYSFYPPRQERGGTMRFWFADWILDGTKFDEHEERAYGPILFTLYTLSRGTLKLSAQFPPLGDAPKQVDLQVRNDGNRWKTVATSEIDPDAWNAVFRVTSWDDSKDLSYRLLYAMLDTSGKPRQYAYEGTIRKDPKDKSEITVGLLTCIWDMGFPHSEITSNLLWHEPDILLWTGDQVYERVGGFGVMRTRDPKLLIPSMHDYLRKWYVFGWAVRDLTREIPSVCMVDDHDMFHGNLWGCGGKPTDPGLSLTSGAAEDSGGYMMPPRWVKMAQRSQTAHLPDPFDPTPVLQGITAYYTDLRWGGVSFAILEDRKWKSAPKIEIPEADIIDGFAKNSDWDARKGDVSTAELLGERQLDFLEYWAADWSHRVWMKFAVSQTLFGCLHTFPSGHWTEGNDDFAILPVGKYPSDDSLMADHDSGGWPQHGRNDAIRKWRKGFALHLCGDQHLGTTSHYGVESFRDGVYAVCTPAISNSYPRRWCPPNPGKNALPRTRNTGDYLDRFGNHITVLAAANPHQYPGTGLQGLRYRATGYSILRCRRDTREVQIEVWPRWVDSSKPGARPYPGWPITVRQIHNGLYGAAWVLEKVETPGQRDPVIQIQREPGSEVVYTLRIKGESFTPLVREPGTYTVVAFDPDNGYYKVWSGITARKL